MSAGDTKARSRAIAREWEAKHGRLNLYKEDFAEEAELGRSAYERATEVFQELHRRLFNHRRRSAGQPPLDEAKMAAYLAEGEGQLPLHFSPAMQTAERALACLPDAAAFADVAVMLVSTPDLSATAISEGDVEAICVSWTLLQALYQGNGVMERFLKRRMSPTDLAKELRGLRPILTLDSKRMGGFHPDQLSIEPVVLQVLQALFLVFHEGGHIVLGHLSLTPSLEHEIAADDFAFRGLRHVANNHLEIFEDLVPSTAIEAYLLRAVFNFFAINVFLHSQRPVASSHPDPIARFDHFTRILGLSEKDRTGARLNLEGLKLLAELCPH